jgi:hypothetical protein
MPALRKSMPFLFALVLLGQSGSLSAEARPQGVGGRVLGESAPLASARIYAWKIADLSIQAIERTDANGNFLLKDLPAGLYKIIAHKSGFLPAVILLTRTTAQAYQQVDVQLQQQRVAKGSGEDDYWALRARVPADVLHQIEMDEAGFQLAQLTASPSGMLTGNFQTDVQALTGVDQIAAEGGQISGAGVGFKGQIGQTQVGVRGRFFAVNGDGIQPGRTAGAGQARSLAIDFSRGDSSRVSIQSSNNRMMPRSESGDSGVDFESYQVNWTRDVGENGRSEFAAHYTSENNFYRPATVSPLDIPETSQSWRIEGAYTFSFSDRNTLQTGLRYRERQFGFGAERPGKVYERQALSSIVRLQPAVLMEYGLYSTLSDGTLALTPQGGMVLQLASNWQLETSAAHRVYADSPLVPDFLPTLFEQRDLCEQGSEACYQVNLSRKDGDDNALTFGAIHREVGDTLRLYFSDDFFDREESLYLVRGDELPELRFGFRRKLSPQVVTSLDTSLAAGGGGLFVSPGGEQLENKVRYLVTSLDTQLLSSSTGIFVAFHHLEQQLDYANDPSGRTATQMDFERLQLMVNQNLNFLIDLASDWAVQLNMELSRGGSVDPATHAGSDDRIRRRVLGGIAIKF